MTTAICSDFLEESLLNLTFRNTAYVTPALEIWVSLHTANPTDVGNGSEVIYTSYARIQVTAWDAPASRATQNTNQIDFVTPGGNGNADITHIGIWDSVTAGNLLFYGALTTAKTAQSAIPLAIGAGAIDISFGGAVSTYLAHKWINHVLRNTAFTTPGTAIYVGLDTDDPTVADSGTEVSGGTYGRIQVTAWDAPAATSGATQNTGTIQFATPTASWGTITHVKINDALTTGNMLYFGTLSGGGLVGVGDDFHFVAGALDLSIS